VSTSQPARPKPRAAHFLLVPELLHSPPNRAIIEALLGCGYQVDVFAPGEGDDPSPYGSGVRTHRADYTLRWLSRHLADPGWWGYACFSGTSEDPLAVVGLLAALTGRPSFVLVDEIKSGSYRGNSPERWKQLCRWAMRRARFSIVNDESRVALLRDYASLPREAQVLVYPGCFHQPPARDLAYRQALRQRWGLPQEALVIASSGALNLTAGADWLVQALQELPDLHAVIQPLAVSPLCLFLLGRLGLGERLYLQQERLSWQEAWRSAVGVDIGLAIYTNPAPQFQHMGTSSNRLCMFLAMGVPVIATRQPSFRFLEDYDCGVLVEDYGDFRAAIATIGSRLEVMRANCRRCFEDYIMPPGRFSGLQQAIASLPRR
jgi:glycosyltransferase involved in cell wall biosynthesis